MTPRKDEDAWGIWCNGNTAVCGTAIQRSTRCFPTICRIYLHPAGKKEEKAEFEKVRTSRYSSRQLLRLGVRLLRFCEFFVGKKNKTRILCTFSITVIILASKAMGSEFES